MTHYTGLTNDELEDFESCPAFCAVQDYLDWNRNLYRWNDNQDSAQPVIATLRACAVIEAAREEQDAAWETYAAVVSA
jgi:hypothetical protein